MLEAVSPSCNNGCMFKAKNIVKAAVQTIVPYDAIEIAHKEDVLRWLESDASPYRISKPDNPPKHLVSYFVPFDEASSSMLLVDHVKAGLRLPPGGHVDVDEDPRDTVVREAYEELNIAVSFDTPIGNDPLFVTVTTTRGAGSHTDVSLWYVVRGDAATRLGFDAREMDGYSWLTFDEVLATDIAGLDPHLHRFIRKLRHALV